MSKEVYIGVVTSAVLPLLIAVTHSMIRSAYGRVLQRQNYLISSLFDSISAVVGRLYDAACDRANSSEDNISYCESRLAAVERQLPKVEMMAHVAHSDLRDYLHEMLMLNVADDAWPYDVIPLCERWLVVAEWWKIEIVGGSNVTVLGRIYVRFRYLALRKRLLAPFSPVVEFTAESEENY